MKKLRPLTMCFFCRTITGTSSIFKYKGCLLGRVCEECDKSTLRKLKNLLKEPARRFADLKIKGVLHG